MTRWSLFLQTLSLLHHFLGLYCDELMGLVTQLQGQVAQLTAAKEELHKQLAELKRAGKRQAVKGGEKTYQRGGAKPYH